MARQQVTDVSLHNLDSVFEGRAKDLDSMTYGCRNVKKAPSEFLTSMTVMQPDA